MEMDFSSLMASIATALDKLNKRWEKCSDNSYKMELEISMRWLRVVRTFFPCSTLADNVELRNGASNDDAVTSRRSQKKRMKQKKRRMRKGLGSLLVRVEDVVRRILNDLSSIPPPEPFGFQYDLKSLEEEIDKWYTRLSDYLKKYSTSPVTNQMKVILDSLLENSKDFMNTSSHDDWEPLINNIQFLINFIRFGTLLCADNQEFQYSFTQIQLHAIDAAHLTLHQSSFVEGPTHLPNGLTNSMVKPFLHEAYASALASLKHSQETLNPTLDFNDPFVTIMEDFVTSLLSTLWSMLQSDTSTVVALKDKLQTVDRGLRFLRTILKNQPEKFDDGKIKATTVAAICDYGVIIISLDRKDFDISHTRQEFLESIQMIRLEVIGYVLETNFPQTNVWGFLDFLLEDYMEEAKGSMVDSDTLSVVQNIQEYLVFLKSFVGNLLELRNRRKNVHQDLWDLSVEVAYKIESLIDQLVVGDTLESFSRSVQSIAEDITSIKAKSLQKFDEGRQDIIKVQEITNKVPSIISSTVVDEVVGFESEKASIINQLLGGFSKLKVVSVVGMPGSGKTTLATEVYKDSCVTHCFHKMASCSISQVFDRRKVLLELLNQTEACEIKSTLDANDLSHELWKSLIGYKYLIFIDDIWDIKAFEILKESLPDGYNASRILVTSRHGDVVPEALLDERPLFLRHLTMDEGLKLLQRKLFPAQKDWPSALNEFGMEIVEYCKGLPLTLVIIAGFLKTQEQEGWKDVLKTLRSSTVSDLTVRTMELSYTHLPDHLKPLFLWFGAFPEDHEIPVKNMIRLWISEGLVRKFESSEEVARGYVNILIARGLVMVAGRRSEGGVKTCRIHDLLRDFCLRIFNEEFFLHIIKADANEEREQFCLDEAKRSFLHKPELLPSVELRNIRRLCIYSSPQLLKWRVFCPRLRSLLFFGETRDQKLHVSVIFCMLKLLRVLDIGGIEHVYFQSEICALAQLRYLAISVNDLVHPAIGNLSKLEILILNKKSNTAIELPDTIWNLQKLRHLCTGKRYLYLGIPCIGLPLTNLDSSCNLVELETLSIVRCVHGTVMKKQLNKFPNIRRLRLLLIGNEDGSVTDTKALDFSFLSQLDSFFYEAVGLNKLAEVVFPRSIKKLTLFGCRFPWSRMSSIAKLPHLSVLKLLQRSFDGEAWDFDDEEDVFPNMKFLKLENLRIVRWTAASKDQFPKLEKLVLYSCSWLQEIPVECMGDVDTLSAIEVIRCPRRVVRQVRKIEEIQKEYGTLLQVHLRGN